MEETISLKEIFGTLRKHLATIIISMFAGFLRSYISRMGAMRSALLGQLSFYLCTTNDLYQLNRVNCIYARMRRMKWIDN
ncbi:hypothetical protein EfmAA610_20750 [Enterococcus faecium]|nr:hypothetical protein EfmAA610_20750 [Enterococcus faecium]